MQDFGVRSDPSSLPRPSFEELVQLLVSGNAPATGYSGFLTEVEDNEMVRRRRVWRLGNMMRIEDPPGHTRILAGERTVWVAGDDVDEEAWGPRDPDLVPRDTEAGWLLEPEEHWRGWLGEDPSLVMRTLGPVTFEGRPAWRFSVPVVQGGSAELVVDIELGLVVRMARDDHGASISWSELTIEPQLGPRFFEPTHRRLPDVPERSDEAEPAEHQSGEDRAHFYGVLVSAMEDWRAVGELVATSEDEAEAIAAVADYLHVDATDAQLILDTQLRRLVRRQRRLLAEELERLEGGPPVPGRGSWSGSP